MAKQIIEYVLTSCAYDYVIHTNGGQKPERVKKEFMRDDTIERFVSGIWQCDIKKIRRGEFRVEGFRGTPTKFKVILLDK